MTDPRDQGARACAWAAPEAPGQPGPAGRTIAGEGLAAALHDLQHPLATIRILGQLGLKGAGDEATRDLFRQIVAQVDQGLALLDELRRGAGEEPAAPLSPAAAVREVLAEAVPECRAAGVEVALRIEGEAEARLRPGLFRRALRNLVANAVQAMAGGGRLAVRVGADGGQVIIAVADTGPGIPPDLQAALFRPFVTGRAGGSGLGLYLVHRAITEGHGGRVWFDTQPGRGTTFFVALPRCGVGEAVGAAGIGQRLPA